MPVKSRRWNDPPLGDEGRRILVTRYRPRGVSRQEQTWDQWLPDLGPSKSLLAAYKSDMSSLSWAQYRRQYIAEQKANHALIQELAQAVQRGETITLICSSACTRESRCHRSLLKELIEKAQSQPAL